MRALYSLVRGRNVLTWLSLAKLVRQLLLTLWTWSFQVRFLSTSTPRYFTFLTLLHHDGCGSAQPLPASTAEDHELSFTNIHFRWFIHCFKNLLYFMWVLIIRKWLCRQPYTFQGRKIVQSRGPRIDPCGTPLSTLLHVFRNCTTQNYPRSAFSLIYR